MKKLGKVDALVILGILVGITLFLLTPVSAISPSGKIIVNHDEWTFSNGGFDAYPTDTNNFALNVANSFTCGKPGNFLVYSTNFGLTQSTLASTMTGAGHTWTVSTSVDFSLPNLLQYDAIFLAGNGANNAVLIDYVNAGGNVYLAGGTGCCGGANGEAMQWNTFLNAFGLNYGTYYNGVGSLPVTSTHSLFDGVNYLYYANGNSVSELNPSDPNTDVLQFSGVHGLIGVYSTTACPTEVNIDIKPGSYPNSINPNNKGVIPVAILTTDSFDASTVDASTVKFGPNEASALRSAMEDVDDDGDLDMILHFRTQETGIIVGDTEAILTGETYSDQKIEGTDSVRVLKTGKNK